MTYFCHCAKRSVVKADTGHCGLMCRSLPASSPNIYNSPIALLQADTYINRLSDCLYALNHARPPARSPARTPPLAFRPPARLPAVRSPTRPPDSPAIRTSIRPSASTPARPPSLSSVRIHASPPAGPPARSSFPHARRPFRPLTRPSALPFVVRWRSFSNCL